MKVGSMERHQQKQKPGASIATENWLVSCSSKTLYQNKDD